MNVNELSNIEDRARVAPNGQAPICAKDFAWLVSEIKRLRPLLEERVEELLSLTKQRDQLLMDQHRLVDILHSMCRHSGMTENAFNGHSLS